MMVEGVFKTFKRLKTNFVLVGVVLSLLIMNINVGSGAINTHINPNKIMNQYPTPLSNGGINWSQIEVISEPIAGQNNNINTSISSKIVIENGIIYVVWGDKSDINGAGSDSDIFYRRYDGISWSDIQIISEPIPGQNLTTGGSYAPDIAVENGEVYVVWYDSNNTNNAGSDMDIFFRCNLSGSNWEDIQVISEPVPGNNSNAENSFFPSIAVDNGKIYTVWRDHNNTDGAGTDADIFFKCNLTGNNWEAVQVISEPVAGQNFHNRWSYNPYITVENNKIYVVWRDQNDTNGAGLDNDIFFICNLTGSNWENIQVISEPVPNNDFNTAWSDDPAIAVENSKIYVVWRDRNETNNAGTDHDIFYRTNLTGSSWETVQVISEPVSGNNFSQGECYYPAIEVENSRIFVAWQDSNNTLGAGNDNDIFYRYNITNSNWEDIHVISEPLEGSDINILGSKQPDIAVNLNRCYFVWSDQNNTDGAGTDSDIFFRWYSYSPLFLKFPNVNPIIGNTSTYFNFTIKYFQIENITPTKITINISGSEYSMLEVEPGDTNYANGKNYYFNTTHLDIDAQNFQIYASDGNDNDLTAIINLPFVYNTVPNVNTTNNLTAIEDTYYEVTYEYQDIDRENVAQVGIWNYSTNATWLSFNPTTAMLYGTPTNDDLGTYWINITINDTLDIDFTNFTLTVINVNDHPLINTTNIEITYEDALYEVDYNATDVDSLIGNQVWSLATNATSWLNINSATGILSGTPTNDDVGDYWVNVSLVDGDGGLAFTIFNLTVLNTNDKPIIDNIDNLTATQGVYYQENYTATDIDPADALVWTFDTNAAWLNWGTANQSIYGTPEDSDVGTQWVKINVSDGEGGFDEHLFDITVENVNDLPVFTKIRGAAPPANDTLNMGAIHIGEYDNFTVEAFDVDNDDLNLYTNNEDLSITKTDWNTWDISYSPTVIGRLKTNLAVLDDGYYGDYLYLYWDVQNRPPSLTITTEDNREIEVAGTYTYIMGTWTDLDLEYIDTIWVKQKFPDGTETEYYKVGYTKEEYGTKSWYYVSGQLMKGVYVWEYLSVYDNHTWIYMFDAEVYNMAYDFYSVNQPEMMEMFGLITKVTEGDMEFTFKAMDNYDANSTESTLTVTYTIDEGEDDPEGDLDDDGLPNGWESDNGLDPLDDGTVNIDNGPDGDPDGDGWTNLQEYQEGTDPQDAGSHPLPPEPPDEVPDDDDEPDDNSAMIAGAVILIIIIIVVLIVVWLFFIKKKPAEEAPASAPPPPATPPPTQPPVPYVQPAQPLPAPMEAVAQPPPVAPVPVPQQPVIQPTVTPQVMSSNTEQPSSDEELEE